MELSKIVIGTMRFRNKKSAISIIKKAIDCGFNYIDTSPAYCYKSENENSEAWVGEALLDAGYRNRVLVSSKCSPGNGGLGFCPFNRSKGLGVEKQEQFDSVFDQTLQRMKLETLDYYHLWTTHTMEQFDRAMRPRHWYDAAMRHRALGHFSQLGLTTHADAATVISFLKTGKFSTVTIPFNVLNRAQLPLVDYCEKNNIRVIAMNPLAGGLLAANARLKELAFRYLLSFPTLHILVGFTTLPQVDYAKRMLDTAPQYKKSRDQILSIVDSVIDSNETRCTGCGYCLPCPNNINVGACLAYYNLYKYMKLPEAKKTFTDKQWDDGLRLDRCSFCGTCTVKCPNQLPLRSIIKDAQSALYANQAKKIR